MSRNAASYRLNRPLDRPAEPPQLARWLLRRVCADSFREAVEGDVEELFRLRLRTKGRLRATLRCFADVFSIAVSGPRQPVRSQYSKSSIPEVIVGTLLQDLRFAVRGLAKSPAFAAVVILTLGLGIGANTTIFSVVNGVLLQPLPYHDPDRIVQIAETDPESQMERNNSMASQRLFLAWRENGRAFSDIAMYSEQAATMTGRDEPIRLTGSAVSPTLFRLLGVDAAEGRTFTADEETPGNDNVILLSSRAWQRYFGGDPDLVGQQLQLDDRSRTVVGIMPRRSIFPTRASNTGYR